MPSLQRKYYTRKHKKSRQKYLWSKDFFVFFSHSALPQRPAIPRFPSPSRWWSVPARLTCRSGTRLRHFPRPCRILFGLTASARTPHRPAEAEGDQRRHGRRPRTQTEHRPVAVSGRNPSAFFAFTPLDYFIGLQSQRATTSPVRAILMSA